MALRTKNAIRRSFMELLAERGLAPVIICESAGTQARDALHMKELYEGFLKSKGDHTI